MLIDIVDGIIKIAFSDKQHKDAWELGTGLNYSINELFKMFNDKFNCKCEYIDNQKGNYTLTLRENDDLINELGWSPKDRLKQHIDTI